MTGPMAALGIELTVIAAPMAGGSSTPALVIAAAQAGSFGQLAGGYKSAQALSDQIAAVRESTAAFGVNLFAPNPVPVDPDEYRRYRDLLQDVADRYGALLPDGDPVEDDDSWAEKTDLLIADPVPLVSFTFGIPPRSMIDALRRAGTVVAQTVTTPAEAVAAQAAGVDLLIVQASGAGGHSGTLTPDRPPTFRQTVDLVRDVGAAVRLPLIAAGGLANAGSVADVLRAGAMAAMVGTALLRSDESGASTAHQQAISDPQQRDTVMTRAFTGRPARAIPNAFIDALGASAPAGYPAVHHLTGPLRRAATAAGDGQQINLWAGTGFRSATAEPASVILRRLAGDG